MRKALYFLIAVFLFSSISLMAKDADAAFKKANQLYQKEDYLAAVELYESIAKKGNCSYEVYYNLGNAYFRTEEFARAILNYERAAKLSPEDSEIKFNLSIARTKIVDKIEPIERFFLVQAWNDLLNSFSSGSWGIFVVIAVWLGFAALSVFFFTYRNSLKKLNFIFALVFFSITAIAIFFASQKYEIESKRNSAIIMIPSAYVKSSPDAGASDLFILHDGTKVELLDELGNWKKIRIEDGNIGWISDQAIEII
ncbi:MAG: tetratricopeptide repeat protein [Ignavibacteria bacterium]|nr:tetratricopeptide repeat protein [Ignavibacteria bacterium]